MLASKFLTVHPLQLETRRFAFGKIRQVKGYLGAPRSLEFRIRKSVTDPILPPREVSDTDRRLAVINRDFKRVTGKDPELLSVIISQYIFNLIFLFKH